jgi:hypothetical protein
MKWYIICLIVLSVLIIGSLFVFKQNGIIDDLVPTYQKGIVSAVGEKGSIAGNVISPNHFSGWSYQISGNESVLYNLKSLTDSQICIIPKDIALKPIVRTECDTTSLTSKEQACKTINVTYTYPTTLTQYDASTSKTALTTKNLATQKEIDNSICFPLNEKIVSSYKIGEQSIILTAQYNYGESIVSKNYYFWNNSATRNFNLTIPQIDARTFVKLTNGTRGAIATTGVNFTSDFLYSGTTLIANTTTVVIYCNRTINSATGTVTYYSNITKVEIYDCGSSSTCAGGTVIYSNTSIRPALYGTKNGNCNSSSNNHNITVTFKGSGGNYSMDSKYLGIGIYMAVRNTTIQLNYNSSLLPSGFNMTEKTVTTTDTNITQENKFAHLTISDPSLVLYYPFDVNNDSSGIVYDYSGNNINGQGYNVNMFNTGVYGSSYNSTRNTTATNNRYIAIPSTLGERYLSNGTQNMTSSAWIKPYKVITGSADIIYATTGYYDGRLLWDSYTGGQCGAMFRNGSQDIYIASSDTACPIGIWTNVLFVKTNMSSYSNLKLYINGILDAELNFTGFYNPGLEGATFYPIGSYPTSYYDLEYVYFNGSIDEIMVFNKSLSATEVAQIYNSTYSRFYPNGEQKFTNLNFGTNNTVNISIANCQTLNGSSLRGKINDGSWTTFTNCNITGYTMSGLLTSANLTIQYNSTLLGFYSPVVAGDIVLDSYSVGGANSCTYSGTGDWAINCADNCVISSPVTAGANSNVTIRGTGSFTTTKNITGFKSGLSAGDGGICTINCLAGGCFN